MSAGSESERKSRGTSDHRHFTAEAHGSGVHERGGAAAEAHENPARSQGAGSTLSESDKLDDTR